MSESEECFLQRLGKSAIDDSEKLVLLFNSKIAATKPLRYAKSRTRARRWIKNEVTRRSGTTNDSL